MKKFLLSGLTILMSTLVWAVAGEEVAGSVPAPAPRLSDVASESSRVSLFSSGGTSTYRYTATGDLSTSTSGADITLYFDVSDYFAEIKSARIELMAYDVDYPGATEADITYLNGVDLNQWLKGENGDWEKNTIQITNLSILKTPAVNGRSVRNTFYVDVNAHNGGWVTCISEAILIIEGTTFTVTASDGADAEGVHVQWTSLPNATYTLWRGEKRGEKTKQLGEGVFTTTEFLDTEVSSGKVYYYTVEVTMSSNESVMASDSGYHDNALFPNIEKIELPKFWLEDRAPLAITWNNYDDKKFRVSLCKVTLVGPSGRSDEISVQEIKPKERVVFDIANDINAKLCKPFSDNDFGNHQVVVTWEVEELKGGIWWTKIQHNLKKTADKNIEIFFNKYERNNWYYFWPKTGAIKEGYIGDSGKFAYSTKRKNGEATPNYEEKRIGNAPEGFPNVYEVSYNGVKYGVTSYGARRKKIQEVQKDGEGGICIGGGGIGLKSLQLVLSHELKHGELLLPYYDLQKGYIRLGKGRLKSDYANIQEIIAGIEKLGYSNFTDENWIWLNALITAYRNKTYVCDLDGDYLLDHEEAGYGYGFVVGDPDTYNLEKYKGEEYAKYGDNEYLAIKAEETPTVNIDTTKDWAFPGTKLCGQYEENLDAKNTMTPEEAWNKSNEKKEALKTFDAFGDNPRSARSVAMMSLSSDEDSLTMQTLSLTDDIQTGGDLVSLPELFETEDGTLSIASGLIDQTPNYAVLRGYKSLAVSLCIENDGEMYTAAEISAYLVDTEGAPVAFAQTTCNLPNGKTEVILEFPGASLRRIKTDSYQLALIQVRDANSEFCDLFFSKTQFENNTFAYNNTQFTGLKANFLYNTFTEEKTQEVLTINVNAYVSEPGVYQIEARLEDLEGNMISHIVNEVEFASGEVTASFDFPSEDIYLSRQNGPYDICFVRISQDGVVLDERRMPYQTSTYSYTDFTPENVCLVIDESSFKRGDDVVGTDGLITNLSFSFDVDYQGEEDVQCQGRLSLYGENDTIVAVSQETFSLVKGRNTLEFLVDGYSIQKSGINGPYYVKGVLLEPQNGAAECFEPKMTPIELNADDFGAYPFVVTDRAVARENNGNYDLIVPIEIDRAHTLTLYAMLVDAKEQCVATATTSKTYSAPCEDELILTFTAADIAASERCGPYKVRLIQATTDIPNIEMVSIPVPIATPMYEVVNEEVTITGCISPFGTLEIPDVIEGCPVTTIAAEAFKDCSNLTSVTIPESVTTIGNYAFSECSSLTSVTIPEGVTSIGNYAFSECSSLTSVTIPSSVTSIGNNAFSGIAPTTLTAAWLPSGMSKNDLNTLIIPEGVTSIGGSAFEGCTDLTSVTIPSSVTSIGDSAFEDCESLTSVTIPEGVTSIGGSAFEDCESLTSVTIPEGVTSIGGSAFEGCSDLTSVTIPSSVTSIGDSAFEDCESLTSVTIPEGVTTIGYRAFCYCSSLTSVTIPSSVTSIGYWAFYNCSSLTSVHISNLAAWCGINFEDTYEDTYGNPLYYATKLYLNGELITDLVIPEGVTSIGERAFHCCSSLTSVTIPSSVTSIGERAFSGCSGLTSFMVANENPNYAAINGLLCSKDGKTLIACPSGSTSATIPSSVTSIGNYAFEGCFSLTSVTIPSSVTSIGEDAFYGVEPETLTATYFPNCGMSKDNLKTLIIPEGVTSIKSSAFEGCSSLTSVTIPSSVTSIGEDAFEGCSSLTSFVVDSANQHYSAINDLLCSKDGKTLVACPGGLTSVTIPEGVTSIGDEAFRDCLSLTSVTIPSSVTIIGDEAFYNCSSLTSVTIPEGVTSIGDSAFCWCSGLTSVTIPSSVITIGNYAFEGCFSLTSVTIPSSVTSIGDYAFEGCSSLTSVTIPESVTSIGDRAFCWCPGLTSVTIPSSVTSIGDRAFEGCSSLTSFVVDSANQHYSAINDLLCSKDGKTLVACPGGLTSVTIPSSVITIGNYAFESCFSLTSVTIPSSVTSIGDEAFYNCSSLTSVTIPSSVTSIGDYAFYGCFSLTSVTIPESVTSIGDDAFSECSGLTSVTIPSSVTSIGDRAFCWCSGLTSVTIPSSVTSIGDYAFYGCFSLTSVTIPESVTSIGDDAFSECSGLTSVTIPSSVTSIGNGAFSGCSDLTSVTIPEGVTSIGDEAFYCCRSLTSVTIPESVTSIGNGAFSGCSDLTSFVVDSANQHYSAINNLLCSKDGKTLVAYPGGLTSVTIPSSVTSIGDDAFSECSGLTSVTIPSSVTSIGDRAFCWCSGLTSVTIPSSVTTIGVGAFSRCSNLGKDENGVQYESAAKVVLITVPTSMTGEFVIPNTVRFIHSDAFRSCSSLTSVTIPSSVTSIGDYAFTYCSRLTSVTIPSSVTSIGDRAFCWCSGLTSVTIPSSVTSIGISAFEGCSSLTSVTIPSSVTSIGSYAFYNCSSLTSVTIPEGVTSIGHQAFSRCSNLWKDENGVQYESAAKVVLIAVPTSMTGEFVIPNTVRFIHSDAFCWCSGLTSVTIPSSVTAIENSTFYGCSGLTSVDFKGEPPSVGSNVFYNISSSATGSYLPQYASEWEAVITDGKWNGLKMVQKADVVTLPEGLPEATGEWLTNVLEASGITSGSAVLAEGTTVEALESARLLGITPSVSVSGNIATVAAESTFEVSEVVVADNALSLAVTITVEAGRFPTEVSLGGAVKLMVCDTLNGAWTEVTPSPTQIRLTRMSDTEATLAVTQALDTYKFFKVLVK